ncbi:hypothetical protein EYE40_10385 [Glaciihabitans arcticus]|uniref:Uncharacterized protein n=1 Tax=Glaciihabitans arcticus TaxID=2668039 RepID=A0A4Q9GRZ6_9MICO|nr:hypothetical protein [Glaciihabitans arcticus]TBN57762.1 hypothetical protein EYE40_10385 [Glaciihabitans arcticus]
MVGGDRTRAFAGVAIAAISILMLAGCAESSGGSGSSITLAQTKSPTQLLRNETASRVPTAVIAEVASSEDTSIRCKTEKADPKGLMRSWKSTVTINVESGSAWRTKAVVDEMAASLVTDGWEASKGFDSAVQVTLLTSEQSAVGIELGANQPEEGSDKGATIYVSTTGPCVATAGEDSTEIRDLEGQGD